MCGRYVLKSTLQQLGKQYGTEQGGKFSVSPNYNVAPSMQMPVVFERDGKRKLDSYRWGMVPFWADSVKTGYSMINARAESLNSKRSFSRPFQSKRCIVPASGFYEWQKEGSLKVPHYITRKNQPFMHFAGLYEQWKSPEGVTVNSYAIITTRANKPVSKLHDRMPAMLLPEEFDTWLNPENNDTLALQELLRPWPDDDISYYRVSTDVNHVRNKGEYLIEPYKDLFSE